MQIVNEFLRNFDSVLEKRFREQAEMLDERFAESRAEIGGLRTDIDSLKRDMKVVREGVGLLLKRRR